MGKYLVNFNVFATAIITANSEKDARNSLSDEEVFDIVKNEIENNGVEIGTVEEYEF